MKNKKSIFLGFALMLISNFTFGIGECPYIEEVRLWDNSYNNVTGQSPTNYEDYTANCIPLFETQFTQINVTSSQGNVFMAMYADLDENGTFETQIFNFFSITGGVGVNPTSIVQPGTPIRVIVSAVQILSGDLIPICGEVEDYVICGEEDPCEDCFNFLGIEVINSSGCDYELVMDYAATGNCGAITIVSETWDFDHMPGGTGSGYHTTHTFPGNGTYNVTATIVYTTATGLTCTAVQTLPIVVTGCGIIGDPCEDCFNFFGIVIFDSDGCDYEFVMNYAATGNCGAVSIVSETWDFGHMPGGTGSGYYTSHSFPGNGTYNVTATIVYTTSTGATCTAVQTLPVVVTGCEPVDPCEDCFNFLGIEIIKSKECSYELVMNYAATGNCGAISIVSETWDFGHMPGGTGSGYHTTHTFPGNGVYTITATIVYTTATGETCTSIQTLDVAVNGCNDCDCVNGGAIQTWNGSACSIGFWLGGFGIDGCATLQPGYTWDFGDGSGGTTGTNWTYHTYTNPGTYAVTVSFTVVNNSTGIACTQTYSMIIEVDECGKKDKSISSNTPPIDLLNVSVFPNPSEDVVTFSIDSPSASLDIVESPELIVYDQMGREVHRSTFEENTQQTISFRDIGSGFYLYRITQNGQLIGSGELIIK